MKALLLDLQGVLFEDGTPLPGAVEAVRHARAENRILRFVTNTATRHPAAILEDLRAMGFEVDEGELFTAPLAARNFLLRQQWRPHALVHPAIRSLFDDLAGGSDQGMEPDCVVLGDARDDLSYANLNVVYRLVRTGRPLIGIGMNRCFREGGEWMLDAGAFIHAIEWAAHTEALVMGKPSAAFFNELVASTGVAACDCLMIGDDVEADVGGAMAQGIAGCLVRTGKFQEGDRDRLPEGAALIGSITEWSLAA
jgi:HAD superfamily hydrolase (TIGR01458 family)